MRLARPAALLALALAACRDAAPPPELDLARVESRATPLLGDVGNGARVVLEGTDLWLVAPVPAEAWRAGEGAGVFRATLPVLAVGSTRAGGPSYRLRAGARELVYEPDGERFGSEPGRFAVRAAQRLALDLVLAEGATPPAGLELWALVGYQERDAGQWRVAGRRMSGAGIWVPTGAPRVLDVAFPQGSSLRFATVVEPLLAARELRTAPHVFRVLLDGAPLFEGTLEVGELGEALRWHEVPLPAEGARTAELTLEVDGPLALTAFLGPRIVPGVRAEEPALPDLVVFLADTFRADNLAAYGCELGLTPAIDAFANEARVFTEARSTGTHTLPVHSTLFSGLYPGQLGQVGFFNPLPGAVDTLAERLSAAGYRCGAVTDGVMVSEAQGMAQGFESFDERREVPLMERVRAFLDADDGRPVFLFAQTYRVHAPYWFGPETRERWEDRLLLDRSYAEVESAARELGPQPEGPPADERVVEIARRLHDLYRAGVVELDATFAEFRAELEGRGMLAEGVLLFTSDHGEAFYEHGRPFHANTPYEEELRVPLLLHAPGVEAGRDPRPVSLVDVAPTLARLAGLRVPPEWSGHSLLDPPERRTLYAFQANAGFVAPDGSRRSTLAVVEGEQKLIGFEDAAARGRLHAAFDLERDPGERRDVAGVAPWPGGLLERHARILDGLLTPLVASEQLDPTGDQLEQLRAMGYGGEGE